ncbi:ABC transporter substrate-binding protein [Thaumasiovibrio sp. DFM-14]|uniref:ABC transporter substrate-binding protein n=1 Tax=Thaumasiovibrio sp. DFM-14 TaxID=3384792 RepID=UPI0039A00749
MLKIVPLTSKVVFCTLLITLLGCQPDTSRTRLSQRGIVYCGQSALTTLNPQLSHDNQAINQLGSQIFERLLDIDPNSHHPLPALAKSWEVSNDRLAYTFYLRQGVSFQSAAGFAPSRFLNADDVVFSFKRIIDPTHPFHYVSGGRYPWFESLGFANLVADIVAESPYSVTFFLKRTDNAFLSILATAPAVIHSQEYADYLVASNQASKIDHHPLGSGPFNFIEYKENSHIRLQRHWGYWQGAAKMEQVVFDLSTRGVGRLAKLLTGECDIIDSPHTSQIAVIINDPDYELRRQTGLNVSYLAINQRSEKVADPLIRKAILTAIDRQKVINSVLHGAGSIADSILPPASWAFDSQRPRVGYNPKIAKAYLDNSRYQFEEALQLAFFSRNDDMGGSPHKTAELIQSDLAAIGLKVELTMLNPQDSFVLDNSFSYDLLLTSWRAANGDPDSFLRPILSCDAINVGTNNSQWCNLQFDNLLELALKTNQEKQRMNYYRLAQDVIEQHTPVIPLLHSHNYQAHHRSIGGVQLSPFGTRSFVTVYRSE